MRQEAHNLARRDVNARLQAARDNLMSNLGPATATLTYQGGQTSSLPASAELQPCPPDVADIVVKQTLAEMAHLQQRPLTLQDRKNALSQQGIWVSRPLWARIRQTLEIKLLEVDDLKLARAKADAGHRHMLQERSIQSLQEQEHWSHQCRELEVAVASRDACIAKLQRRISDLQESQAQDAKTHRDQTLELERVNQTASDAVARQRQLEDEVNDLQLKLRASENRSKLVEGRVQAQALELQHGKEKALHATRIVEEKASCLADLTAQNAELRAQIDMYTDQLSERMKPSLELQRENSRLVADCKRLIAMVETTSEYKDWIGKKSALRGVHYIPIAECFVEEHVLSEVYAPERDRIIDFEVEDFHWVPKKAVDLTIDLLGRQFPSLPVAPFMHLLTQLNQARILPHVWKARENEAVRTVTKCHKQELVALKKLHRNMTPYQENVLGQRVEFLKKELKQSNRKTKTLTKYRAKVGEHLQDNNRVLLNWGLAAIDKLTDHVKDSSRENAHLRKRLLALKDHVDQPVDESSHRLPNAHVRPLCLLNDILTLSNEGVDFILSETRPRSASATLRMADFLSGPRLEHGAYPASTSPRPGSSLSTEQNSPSVNKGHHIASTYKTKGISTFPRKDI